MSFLYKLGKKCKRCSCDIYDKNKSGFCSKHRDRSGKNNSFFGKTHSEKTKELLSKTSSTTNIEKWKNPEYRNKVITAISKPRREGFKKEQSERITQWYKDNPTQRKVRSKSMSENWKTGKVIPNKCIYQNRSKIELDFYDSLEELYPYLTKETIKIGSKWFFPDCVSKRDCLIIEFFGDYWHGNPIKFKPEDIVAKNTPAKEVWERDRTRISKLEDLGYTVMVIWENEYKKNKEEVLNTLSILLNWDACCF